MHQLCSTVPELRYLSAMTYRRRALFHAAHDLAHGGPSQLGPLRAALVQRVMSVALLAILATLATVPVALGQALAKAEFSAQEIQQILTLGPWPPAPQADPSNRVSGKALAIELGRRLFRDPRMSPVGYIACVTCHQPDRSFTDLKARAHGLADLPRNTPTLVNLRQHKWFGWDGASDSLWMASIRPMLDSREIDGSPATVAKLFSRDPELAACHRKVFQRSPLRDPQHTLVNVGKALAYQETLVTARTPFDEFRDALAELQGAPNQPRKASVPGAAANVAPPRKAARTPLLGNPQITPSYPAAALRGLKLFVGQANCVACHQGPSFSDDRFHNVLAHESGNISGNRSGNGSRDGRSNLAGPTITLPPGPSGPATGHTAIPDTGRLAGAISLKSNRLNLAGAYNDDRQRSNPLATQRLVAHEDMRGQFRTPGLRNVNATPPYMHDGRFDRLQEAVRHGGQLGLARSAPGGPVTEPASARNAVSLSTQQADDLAAFLATLTDAYGQRRPCTSAAMVQCP